MYCSRVNTSTNIKHGQLSSEIERKVTWWRFTRSIEKKKIANCTMFCCLHLHDQNQIKNPDQNLQFDIDIIITSPLLRRPAVKNVPFLKILSFKWKFPQWHSDNDKKNKVYVYEQLIRPLVLGISWFWYSSSTSGKSGEMQDSVSCQKNTFSSQQSVTKRGTRRQLIRINQKADNDPAILNNFTSRNNPSHPWQKI